MRAYVCVGQESEERAKKHVTHNSTSRQAPTLSMWVESRVNALLWRGGAIGQLSPPDRDEGKPAHTPLRRCLRWRCCCPWREAGPLQRTSLLSAVGSNRAAKRASTATGRVGKWQQRRALQEGGEEHGKSTVRWWATGG
eukprot:1143268-Pelagomonas_calceolata.AAC.7